jgi:hypothetical protein
MKRIKLFTTTNSILELQIIIDKWIEENNPDIISVTSSMTYHTGTHISTLYTLISVLYDDGKTDIKI